MLIDHLDVQEKNALLLLLKHLSRADGATDDAERQFIKDLTAAVGHRGNQRVSKGRATVDDLCDAFQRPVAQRAVLVKLVQIGWADGDYDDNERARIRDFAARMGVSLDVVGSIERAVESRLDWDSEQGRRLLGL